MRQRLREGDQPLPPNLSFILCLFPTSSALFPFCQGFLCASSSVLPKIGIEYPHKTHIHTHECAHTHAGAGAPVHTHTHGVPQTVLRLQQILANHMKRASSSCGLFIKKRKSERGKPLSMQLSLSLPLTGCTLSLCPSLTKRTYMERHVHTMNMKESIFLHSVSFCMKDFSSDVDCRQRTMSNLPSFPSLFVSPFALRCSSFTTQP